MHCIMCLLRSILVFGASSALLSAGESKAPLEPAATPPADKGVDWFTGEGVSLGGVLFPHFHFNAAYGRTTADELEHFAAGHHDPATDGWTIQGVEAGLSGRFGQYFEAFGNIHVYQDATSKDWDHHFEEWFGKVKNLPGGFELRGGKYLNRFGFHNATHLHGWDWADNLLPAGRFFGDDGLYTIGGELTWNLPVSWTSALSVSVGEAQREEHDHAHHGGEEHEEDAPRYEGEGALFDDVLVSANWTNAWTLNDFHQFRGGLSGAWGDNVWGLSTQLYGAHFEYQWRENGLERGGNYFRWRTEGWLRRFDARSGHLPGEAEHGEHEEHGEEEHGAHAEHEHEHEHEEATTTAALDDFGLATSALYGVDLDRAGVLEAGLRYEYLTGVGDAGLAERHRISPVATWYANHARTFFVRLQYNWDHFEETGNEHSVWAQVGFNWGGPEVR